MHLCIPFFYIRTQKILNPKLKNQLIAKGIAVRK